MLASPGGVEEKKTPEPTPISGRRSHRSFGGLSVFQSSPPGERQRASNRGQMIRTTVSDDKRGPSDEVAHRAGRPVRRRRRPTDAVDNRALLRTGREVFAPRNRLQIPRASLAHRRPLCFESTHIGSARSPVRRQSSHSGPTSRCRRSAGVHRQGCHFGLRYLRGISSVRWASLATSLPYDGSTPASKSAARPPVPEAAFRMNCPLNLPPSADSPRQPSTMDTE